jgi:hypothetical protein
MPEGMMKTRKRLLANERVTKFNPSRPGLIRLDPGHLEPQLLCERCSRSQQLTCSERLQYVNNQGHWHQIDGNVSPFSERRDTSSRPLLALAGQCGARGAFELYCLFVQPGNACAKLIQIATIALQAFAEARHDCSQFGQRLPPGCDGRTLPGDCAVEAGKRPFQTLLSILRRPQLWRRSRGRKSNDRGGGGALFGHGLSRS